MGPASFIWFKFLIIGRGCLGIDDSVRKPFVTFNVRRETMELLWLLNNERYIDDSNYTLSTKFALVY